MQFRHTMLFLAITAGSLAVTGCGGTVGKGSSASAGTACLSATGCSGGTVSAACTTTTCSGTVTTGCATATGCSGTGTGGEDDDDDRNERRRTTAALAITPSLGEIHYATVNIYDAARQLLASGDTGEVGGILVDAAFAAPVVVEVVGDNDASYFDEAAGTNLPFSSGTLHALAPAGSTQIGVSVLTEIAYQMLAHSGAPLTDTNINAANEVVRRALAPDLSSILARPATWDVATTAGSLGSDDGGEYALLLGAFAQLGAAGSTPALSIIAQLDADLADGVLDGQAPAATGVTLSYRSTTELSAALRGRMTSLAASYGDAALQERVGGMVAGIHFDITPPIFTGK